MNQDDSKTETVDGRAQELEIEMENQRIFVEFI